MKETWRWFGPQDPVSLQAVAEAGATGVVSALHAIPGGTAWDDRSIAARKAEIAAAGLTWSVVESIPVTNAIKARSDAYAADIGAWKDTLAALGRGGVTTVCYNFMPIVDWTRTDLAYPVRGGRALRFDMVDLAAYDIAVLGRPEAAADYGDELAAEAEARAAAMDDGRRADLERIILAGLPGSDFSYDARAFLALWEAFRGMTAADLAANLHAFLADVVPVAEEHGIRLCIHPDDPPFPIFGLPRVVSTEADAAALLAAVDSPANGLTLCTGSYGARPDNDLPAMIRRFGPRIHFLHLRNVRREADRVFHEAEHLDGSSDMVAIVAAVLEEEARRAREGGAEADIPMRPDHGHLLAHDPVRDTSPGYSYIGRLKGLAELRGVARALAAG